MWLLAVASITAWVPLFWPSQDARTLPLVENSAFNCLLQSPAHWSGEFVRAAHARQIAVVGALRPEDALPALLPRAKTAGLDGLVLLGSFSVAAQQQAEATGLPVIVLPERSALVSGRLATARQGLPFGTVQGVWPGLRVEEDPKAMPSGAPWIDTNAGFLRYLRALRSGPIWLANAPPPTKPGELFAFRRVLQAVAESAMCGAYWVVQLPEAWMQQLFAGEAKAVRDWQRLKALTLFAQQQREVGQWPAAGQLALVQSPQQGALLSGSILDMIAVKHTPVKPVPPAKVGAAALQGAAMAVVVDRASLPAAQQAELEGFQKRGGTVLTGPPGWQFPAARPGQIVLEPSELEKLDTIWKEVNSMTGRRNLGARLFNVASMLSNLVASPNGQRLALHLVNYTDFPAEAITVHLLGKWKAAQLLRPGHAPAALESYAVDEGAATGVDIAEVDSYAILIVEKP